MILQRLVEYYERLKTQGKVPLFGFQIKEIPFVIELDSSGGFVQFTDIRERSGKKLRGAPRVVPIELKRAGSKSWEKANLLWDHIGYVLGYDQSKPEAAAKQHGSFKKRFYETFEDIEDEGIQAVASFLKHLPTERIQNDPLWPEIAESKPNLTFRLSGDQELISQRSAVSRIVAEKAAEGEGEKQHCLVTGKQAVAATLHLGIKGVLGAQSVGGNIVSFNAESFCSYGKEQGLNAPISEEAAFAYVTVLNRLLGDPEHRIYMGDTTTVFWALGDTPMEHMFASLMVEPKAEAGEDTASIHALFKAPQSGAKSVLEDQTPFCILGLSPSAARLSVRYWYDGTVQELADHIRQYFQELEIVHGPDERVHLPLSRLLLSTALQYKWDNVPPNLTGETLRSVLSALPYPQTLLHALLRRIRAEQHITYARAALLKAILIRNHHKEITVALDTTNKEPGYVLGRLFALIDRAQYLAQGKVNAPIRERYFGSFSSAPIGVFGYLMDLHQHHMASLRKEKPGSHVNMDKEIGEVMGLLEPTAKAIPDHLPPAQQGLFALGFYHQRQHNFNQHKGDEQ
jgi:CRISPR-associated protein Csd1